MEVKIYHVQVTFTFGEPGNPNIFKFQGKRHMPHSKRFKEVNPFESISPRTETTAQHVSIDWNLCVLCQKRKEESLQCPANSKRTDLGAGYKSLAENLLLFIELGMVPFAISLDDD